MPKEAAFRPTTQFTVLRMAHFKFKCLQLQGSILKRFRPLPQFRCSNVKKDVLSGAECRGPAVNGWPDIGTAPFFLGRVTVGSGHEASPLLCNVAVAG